MLLLVLTTLAPSEIVFLGHFARGFDAMRIEHEDIPNGHRYICDGFVVEITNDQRFFTIYDDYNEPCGTITRPLVQDKQQRWASHLPDGKAATTTAVGPKSAFRSFIMGYRS